MHASFKYFSAIPCIVAFIVNIMSSPSVGSLYSSDVFFITFPDASVILLIEPFFPFKYSSYFDSIPFKPWLSLPQNPIICDAKLLYG